MSGMAIGIAGYGKIARDQHVPAIAASDTFELAAIADPGIRHETLPSYPDVAAMLQAHPEVAAVALCMPPRFRAVAAREAIAAGRHVMLEKPPCATMAEVEALADQAGKAGVTLFTAWHSHEAAGVAAARKWLEGASVRSARVVWKEDVRVWHPGQDWIWQEGGFGVFDPGVNALSILTAILPQTLRLTDAELSIPANCATPIAARLELAGEKDFPVIAEFDFRQTGPQSWDIEIEADRGRLVLSNGGNRLLIDGGEVRLDPEGEYRALYVRFADLICRGEMELDLAPLALVEQAFAEGRMIAVEAFEEAQ
jgi:D-galactose 1-dehydrogenase